MLVSHAHRFIYLKTRKTAGTSVEALLEPFCAQPGHKARHGAHELVTPYGIVGFRGQKQAAANATYRNHMSAAEIRDLLPTEFATYTRIANIRNPYDKAVSGYHMASGITVAEAARLAVEEPAELRRSFLQRLGESVFPDREILLLDGRLAIDRLVRFENLAADLEALNADLELGIADIPRRLPTYKKTDRGAAGPPLTAYLGRDSIAAINAQMSWYFELFGYEMIDPDKGAAA